MLSLVPIPTCCAVLVTPLDSWILLLADAGTAMSALDRELDHPEEWATAELLIGAPGFDSFRVSSHPLDLVRC